MTDKAKKAIEIPVLKARRDYRNWKQRLETHLRTKEMINHVKYDFHAPVLLGLPRDRQDTFAYDFSDNASNYHDYRIIFQSWHVVQMRRI